MPSTFIMLYISGVFCLFVTATRITPETSAILPLYFSLFCLYSFILEQKPILSVNSFKLLNQVSLSTDISIISIYLAIISFTSDLSIFSAKLYPCSISFSNIFLYIYEIFGRISSYFAKSFLTFTTLSLSMPRICLKYSSSLLINSSTSLLYFIAHFLTSLNNLSVFILPMIFLDISFTLAISNSAPATFILFNLTSNSEISLSLFCFLHGSKSEFIIVKRYSIIASVG